MRIVAAAAAAALLVIGPGTGPPPRAQAPRTPNEMGRIPILEYHLIGDGDTRWQRDRRAFREDLQLLYERGYRPVSVSELVDRKLNLAKGLSPVVITFDDASPSQFRYTEHDGELEIDPTSALGIWLAFHHDHPQWRNRATFCVLSNAEAGRAFFGNRGIEGQETEWRFRKLRFLVDQGFELCNHTLWHANLGKYSDAVVQEQLARAQLAIDSAVPGYEARTMALPLGIFPRNHELAHEGGWTDPRTGRTVSYRFDAILRVGGEPVASPYSPDFDPLRLPRIQVTDDALREVLDRLDKHGERYVSDGDTATVARPADPKRLAPTR